MANIISLSLNSRPQCQTLSNIMSYSVNCGSDPREFGQSEDEDINLLQQNINVLFVQG